MTRVRRPTISLGLSVSLQTYARFEKYLAGLKETAGKHVFVIDISDDIVNSYLDERMESSPLSDLETFLKERSKIFESLDKIYNLATRYNLDFPPPIKTEIPNGQNT